MLIDARCVYGRERDFGLLFRPFGSYRSVGSIPGRKVYEVIRLVARGDGVSRVLFANVRFGLSFSTDYERFFHLFVLPSVGEMNLLARL